MCWDEIYKTESEKVWIIEPEIHGDKEDIYSNNTAKIRSPSKDLRLNLLESLM